MDTEATKHRFAVRTVDPRIGPTYRHPANSDLSPTTTSFKTYSLRLKIFRSKDADELNLAFTDEQREAYNTIGDNAHRRASTIFADRNVHFNPKEYIQEGVATVSQDIDIRLLKVEDTDIHSLFHWHFDDANQAPCQFMNSVIAATPDFLKDPKNFPPAFVFQTFLVVTEFEYLGSDVKKNPTYRQGVPESAFSVCEYQFQSNVECEGTAQTFGLVPTKVGFALAVDANAIYHRPNPNLSVHIVTQTGPIKKLTEEEKTCLIAVYMTRGINGQIVPKELPMWRRTYSIHFKSGWFLWKKEPLIRCALLPRISASFYYYGVHKGRSSANTDVSTHQRECKYSLERRIQFPPNSIFRITSIGATGADAQTNSFTLNSTPDYAAFYSQEFSNTLERAYPGFSMHTTKNICYCHPTIPFSRYLIPIEPGQCVFKMNLQTTEEDRRDPRRVASKLQETLDSLSNGKFGVLISANTTHPHDGTTEEFYKCLSVNKVFSSETQLAMRFPNIYTGKVDPVPDIEKIAVSSSSSIVVLGLLNIPESRTGEHKRLEHAKKHGRSSFWADGNAVVVVRSCHLMPCIRADTDSKKSSRPLFEDLYDEEEARIRPNNEMKGYGCSMFDHWIAYWWKDRQELEFVAVCMEMELDTPLVTPIVITSREELMEKLRTKRPVTLSASMALAFKPDPPKAYTDSWVPLIDPSSQAMRDIEKKSMNDLERAGLLRKALSIAQNELAYSQHTMGVLASYRTDEIAYKKHLEGMKMFERSNANEYGAMLEAAHTTEFAPWNLGADWSVFKDKDAISLVPKQPFSLTFSSFLTQQAWARRVSLYRWLGYMPETNPHVRKMYSLDPKVPTKPMPSLCSFPQYKEKCTVNYTITNNGEEFKLPEAYALYYFGEYLANAAKAGMKDANVIDVKIENTTSWKIFKTMLTCGLQNGTFGLKTTSFRFDDGLYYPSKTKEDPDSPPEPARFFPSGDCAINAQAKRIRKREGYKEVTRFQMADPYNSKGETKAVYEFDTPEEADLLNVTEVFVELVQCFNSLYAASLVANLHGAYIHYLSRVMGIKKAHLDEAYTRKSVAKSELYDYDATYMKKRGRHEGDHMTREALASRCDHFNKRIDEEKERTGDALRQIWLSHCYIIQYADQDALFKCLSDHFCYLLAGLRPNHFSLFYWWHDYNKLTGAFEGIPPKIHTQGWQAIYDYEHRYKIAITAASCGIYPGYLLAADDWTSVWGHIDVPEQFIRELRAEETANTMADVKIRTLLTTHFGKAANKSRTRLREFSSSIVPVAWKELPKKHTQTHYTLYAEDPLTIGISSSVHAKRPTFHSKLFMLRDVQNEGSQPLMLPTIFVPLSVIQGRHSVAPIIGNKAEQESRDDLREVHGVYWVDNCTFLGDSLAVQNEAVGRRIIATDSPVPMST
jgi:hypothetical protein